MPLSRRVQITLRTPSGKTVIDEVEAYDLTVMRRNKNGKIDIGHTSTMSMTEHVRTLVLSFDSMKVKAAKLMEAAEDPITKKLYRGMADFALAHQLEMQKLDVEMRKVADRQKRRAAGELVDNDIDLPEESNPD